MTVNPGFGGQKFIHSVLPKVKQLSDMIKERDLPIEIEIDGGINEETIIPCVEAGATILVAGSAIYNARTGRKLCNELKLQGKAHGEMKEVIICAGGPFWKLPI